MLKWLSKKTSCLKTKKVLKIVCVFIMLGLLLIGAYFEITLVNAEVTVGINETTCDNPNEEVCFLPPCIAIYSKQLRKVGENLLIC